MQESCEIKIKGHLDPRWPEWLMALTPTKKALLPGPLFGQAALHDLNMTLISIPRSRPSNPDLKEERQ